jgi:hypothetical protein
MTSPVTEPSKIHGCSGGISLDGVDLNRNHPMFFGLDSGSSSNMCSPAFRGSEALSEPESKAIYMYADAIFDDGPKKGMGLNGVQDAATKLEEACPEDGKGIFLDVHAFGKLVFSPWGYHDVFAPNRFTFEAMAGKLASIGDYTL